MPRSSRHKSHKQSKHSSKKNSDSEEDVKMKEKSSKSENVVKVRDSFSGEKRTISSLIGEGKESKDQTSIVNGEASEEYFSTKRRKERSDVGGDTDRWNGGGDERGNNDKIARKETIKGEGFVIESKSKEYSNKGEILRIESKDKSKKYESGVVCDLKEESLATTMLEKDDCKIKGESKRKSEKEYSVRKEGKELKYKDRRLEKEKEKEKEMGFGHENKRRDTDVKLVDMDVAKRQVPQGGDHSEERQVKRSRETSDCPMQDDLKNLELEKEFDKRSHRRRESSSDRGVHPDDFKESEEKGLSTRSSDRARDVKYREEKHKDRTYADRYHEHCQKIDGQRDEICLEEAKKDSKHQDNKYGEEGEKDARRRDDRHRGDGVRESRPKDERHRERERDTKRKEDKYREGTERDDRQRDYRYREDGERDSRRRDDHYLEDGDKDGRHRDGRYHEDGDRDDRRREHKYKEDAQTENRIKEDYSRENNERASRQKDSKQVDDFDREKRVREAKYRGELASGNRSGDKSDLRHSNDDAYAPDHLSRKSSAYDDSPTHDDQRYRDDQGKRRTDDREDYSDVRSRDTKDQRFDADKKTRSGSRMESVPDRGRPTSRNAEVELNSGQKRRQSSPSSNSIAPRDHYRPPKQDDFRYRDYSYEEKLRHNMVSSKDYTGTVVGSEKTLSSRSFEKLGQKDDAHLRELSTERRSSSDVHSSPLKLVDKSPSSSADRRQFSRSNIGLSIDVEESTQKSGNSRDIKDYYGKYVKESHDLSVDRLPGDELSQADADTLSMSSPSVRNNHFSNSSKPFPPPPPPHFRTGMESPSIFGSIEDDNRYRSSSRIRRSVDPNFGRHQGNAWRGVPSWPSPVANGFLSFPHAPPPVSFHSVMQPFAAPPMFGIRPSMDLNHPAPYHISEADRFSGSVRPMGWHNSVDERPPLHAWDANNTAFRDESHIYGRPGWDQSRNLPGSRGWDTTDDMWKVPSRTASFEMPSSEQENNAAQNVDEVLGHHSAQPSQNEQIDPGQQAGSTDVTQMTYDSETNTAEASQIVFDINNVAKLSKKDDVPLCHVYLSRLDISADLTEPEMFSHCAGIIDVDQILESDDSKILLIEEVLETEAVARKISRYSFSATPLDDSVFQRAMSLYKRLKDDANNVVYGDKSFTGNLLMPTSKAEDLSIKNETTKLSGGTGNAESNVDVKLVPNSSPNVDVKLVPNSPIEDEDDIHQKSDMPFVNTSMKSEETVSTTDQVNNVQVVLALTLVPHSHAVEEKPLAAEIIQGLDSHSAATPEVQNDGNIEELMLVDSKHDTIVDSDVCLDTCEAMMPESASVILSRIHHSSESTH